MNTIPNYMFHSRKAICKTPYGAVKKGETVDFSVYPRRKKGTEKVTLWIEEDGKDAVSFPMQWSGIYGARDRYQVKFTPQNTGLYWYYFTIELAEGLRYCMRGYGGRSELNTEIGDKYQLTVYDASYQVPKWFGEGITYNIFPDRFARAGMMESLKENENQNRVFHEKWDEIPVYLPDENGEILNNDFFGGNLRGIIYKLDYLESLHVKTIYFNPIFKAYSNHRYDTGDYKKIDETLGTEEDFKELCEKAKRRGMRVVLDGVFNHIGYDSLYFNARGNYDSIGAYQSKESPYYKWFDFHKWPKEYGSWWGIYTLPQVNEQEPSYQKFITEEKNSVIKYWLKLGASGWRLDVADELPDFFIEKINIAAKKEKEDAVIIGEVWEDASNKIAYSVRRKYFAGNELDSVMNYPLREAILTFLGGGTSEHFTETIECLKENYPRDVFYNLMNIIGTHDTARALTVLGATSEDWDGTREERAHFRLSEERLEYAKKLVQLAAVIQFTMPGSPTIYYGDEVGMQGFEDPFNRGTFPWGKEDREMLDFYRRLCLLRSESDPLKYGNLRFIKSVSSLLHYERQSKIGRVVVLVNRGYHAVSAYVEAVYAIDVLYGAEFEDADTHGLKITVPEKTAYVLRCFGMPDFTLPEFEIVNIDGAE